MIYYRYPVNKIGITSDFGNRNGSFHYGLDLGWFDYQGENIYSIGNGEVIEKGFTSSQGNYVVIKHNDRDSSRYMHLKSPAIVNIGDIVSTGSLLGYMGTTGNSDGVHLHIGFSRDGSYIDPKLVLYVYEDQFVGENTKNNYNLLYYKPFKISPTTRDINKDQIKINTNDLNIRKGPGISYERYTEFAELNAIYDFYEVVENEGYTWYKIADNAYVALVDNSLIVYKAQNTPDKEALLIEIQKLNDEIRSLKIENERLKNTSIKFEYNVSKTGKYNIKLNEGEQLIII